MSLVWNIWSYVSPSPFTLLNISAQPSRTLKTQCLNFLKLFLTYCFCSTLHSYVSSYLFIPCISHDGAQWNFELVGLLDQPFTVNFKTNIFHDDWMSTPTWTSAKPWERAWRATARLQGRRKGEREQRRFKLNALAARMASFWTMVWVWRSRDKAGREWQTGGCTLASGTRLAWPLIHSTDSPADSCFDWEA